MLILATTGVWRLDGKLYHPGIKRPEMAVKMRNSDYGNFE